MTPDHAGSFHRNGSAQAMLSAFRCHADPRSGEILFTMAAQLLIKINVGPSLAERNGQL
jgi:hypothetical protein